MVNNLDWTAALSAIDFLRDVGKHFRVNRMLAKDSVARAAGLRRGHQLHRVQLPDPAGHGLPGAVPAVRLHAADRRQRPVGQHHRRHRPDPPGRAGASVHALATPLITKADGTKFGKTEGGTVWLDPELTSAVRLLPVLAERRRPRRRARTCGIFTFRSREEIEELERREPRAPGGPRGAAGAGRGADPPGARRRPVRRPWPPARRCSAGATWPLDEATLAAALSVRRAAVTVDGEVPTIAQLMQQTGLVAQPVGGPADR